MKRSFPLAGNILIPMQVVKLKFSEKEEVSLNPFQNLILEAIEDGCEIEQIAQATLLTEYVIQTEITQLISQKLLERQGETLKLSDLSQKLLLVSRCVQRLNEEKRLVCINLMTGSVEEYDENHLIEGGGENVLELQPRFRKQEIDGTSMEENIEFFRKYVRTFDGMDEEQTDTVLSSVYVEFIDIGVKKFRIQPIFRLPCLIGGAERGMVSEDSDDAFYARGHMCQIEFSLKSALPAVDDSLLSCLPLLADAGLLSERGLKVAAAIELFQNREGISAYYDYVSGSFQFDEPLCDSGKHKIDLDMPRLHELTEDIRKECVECAHRHFALPSELKLEATDTKDSTYNISGNFNELMEADDG